MNREKLQALADANFQWAVDMRRRLHRIPEQGFKEFKTQKLICEALDELNIPYTTERTWVIGLIEGAQPGPTIALRADIDALPIQENNDLPFASEHDGWMHACGHDIHTAILLGTARMLAGMRGQMKGCVKLMFQPAEETTGGALPMVEAGALENPHVEASYGLHVQPYLPVGAVEARFGALNASSDEVIIDVFGKGGHAAYPERSVDTVVCAAHIITALQTLVSRNISPLSSVVLTFGGIHGGSASNVITDHVRLNGTLRTVDNELRTFARRRVEEIAKSVAEGFGASVKLEWPDSYSALVNHERETNVVLDIARELLGSENVKMKEYPSMGAEDFSYFIENRPGAFYHLGCTAKENLPGTALHSPSFFADEGCIRIGMMMQAAIALKETKSEI